jgi:hypothetical protein
MRKGVRRVSLHTSTQIFSHWNQHAPIGDG